MNEARILGRLATEPELKQEPGKQAEAHFRVAVEETYKASDGSFQTTTDFTTVRLFGRIAEDSVARMKVGNLYLYLGRVGNAGMIAYTYRLIARSAKNRATSQQPAPLDPAAFEAAFEAAEDGSAPAALASPAALTPSPTAPAPQVVLGQPKAPAVLGLPRLPARSVG